MSSDTTTRRAFLVKSAAAAATVAGAELLASTVEAAAPAAHSRTTYELTFWDWWSPVGSPSLTRWFNWVKTTFEKENPGITLKYQFLPWGAPTCRRSRPRWQAATRPMYSTVPWPGGRDLWERNVLYKLNDRVAATPVTQPKQFFPTASITDSESGAIFGVPMGRSHDDDAHPARHNQRAP